MTKPTPPFSVNFFTPDKSSVTGTLLVTLCSADSDIILEATEELVELFFSLLTHGAFGLALQVNQLSKHWDTNLYCWNFESKVEKLPISSIKILLSLLSQNHYAYEPLKNIDFKIDDISHKLNIEDLLSCSLRNDFPSKPIPIDACIKNKKDISISIEFRDNLTEEKYSQIIDCINILDHVLVMGGIQFSFQDSSLSNFGKIFMIQRNILVYQPDWFEGELNDFIFLVSNLCSYIHLMHPTRKITIVNDC